MTPPNCERSKHGTGFDSLSSETETCELLRGGLHSDERAIITYHFLLAEGLLRSQLRKGVCEKYPSNNVITLVGDQDSINASDSVFEAESASFFFL